MVLTPNDLFSWNNKYSKYRVMLLRYIYITVNSFLIFQLCTLLTLCMLVLSSREGVVFLVLLPSLHLTMVHVLPPPVSKAN